MAPGHRRELLHAGQLGEADDAEVRLVHAQEQRRRVADRALVVLGPRAVRRPDLHEPRAGPRQHVRNAEAVADLEQLAAGDDDLASLGERGEREQHRPGVVVDDERALGAGEPPQHVGDVVLARPACAFGEVVLEVRVAAADLERRARAPPPPAARGRGSCGRRRRSRSGRDAGAARGPVRAPPARARRGRPGRRPPVSLHARARAPPARRRPRAAWERPRAARPGAARRPRGGRAGACPESVRRPSGNRHSAYHGQRPWPFSRRAPCAQRAVCAARSVEPRRWSCCSASSRCAAREPRLAARRRGDARRPRARDRLAGTPEAELGPAIRSLVARRLAEPVPLQVSGRTVEIPAAKLFLLDRQATVDAAMDAGRGSWAAAPSRSSRR